MERQKVEALPILQLHYFPLLNNNKSDSHWIVATTVMWKNNEVLVYDLVFNSLDDDTVGIIRNLLCRDNIKMAECQM